MTTIPYYTPMPEFHDNDILSATRLNQMLTNMDAVYGLDQRMSIGTTYGWNSTVDGENNTYWRGWVAFHGNQLAWGRNNIGPFDLARKIAENPGAVLSPWNFDALHFLCLAAGLCGAAAFVRRKEWDFALWLAVPLLFAVSTGALLSLPRFSGALFPLSVFFSRWAHTAARERMLLALMFGLFALMSAMYGAHVTAGMT